MKQKPDPRSKRSQRSHKKFPIAAVALVGGVALLILVVALLAIAPSAREASRAGLSWTERTKQIPLEEWAHLNKGEIDSMVAYKHEAALQRNATIYLNQHMMVVWLQSAGFKFKNVVYGGQTLELGAENLPDRGQIFPYAYWPPDFPDEPPIDELDAPWPTGIVVTNDTPVNGGTCQDLVPPLHEFTVCTNVEGFTGMGLLYVDVLEVFPENPDGLTP